MNRKLSSLVLILSFMVAARPVAAQNTVLTYQGRLMDNGTNFTGTGQFQFALVASTNFNLQAIATANLNGPFVTSYSLISGGSGYTNIPTVTISGGGGSGAAAMASESNGVVTAINPVSAGSNYTSTPTVTISSPPPNITYTTYWSNDGTSSGGSEPIGQISLAVSDGLFTIGLGDTTILNMMPINPSLFAQTNLQLRIWFNDGSNGWAALSPVQNLTPAPYAFTAQSAVSLSGSFPVTQLSGVVSNTQLANSAITIIAGTGLGGGGNVSLGGSNTLNNTGVVSLAGNADITTSATNGAVTLGTTATNSNIPSTIIKRDSNGNFSAGTITLSGALNMANTLSNTATGAGALGNNTTGADNTANGCEALYYNTTGYENTASGLYALQYNTNGFQNTAAGAYALSENTSGSDNTASGWVAMLFNTTGSNNTATGAFALEHNLTGGYNTANGVSAILNNMTGSSNTANGNQALYNNMSGNNNIADGASALAANTSGNNNTACGCNALSGNTQGNNNIALGFSAGTNIYSGNNNIDIGHPGVTGDNNAIRIGSGQTSASIAGISGTTIAGGAAVYVNSFGQLGVITSSERFKQHIQSMGDASDVLLSLRPVTFRYKPELDPKGRPQFGLIAEEVSKMDPDLVVRDDKDQIYTVRYEAINAMLLNEFLKQHQKIEQQQAEIQTLKKKAAQMESLEKRIEALEESLLAR